MRKTLTALFFLLTLTLFGQGIEYHCETVDWPHNANNTNSFRLRIWAFNNPDLNQLHPICNNNSYCPDGKGDEWDGSFTIVKTNGAYVEYHADSKSIEGKDLNSAFLSYNGNTWTLFVIQNVVPSYNPYTTLPQNLWIGTNAGPDATGVYHRTYTNTSGSTPQTLVVECFPYIPTRCSLSLTFFPSPYYGPGEFGYGGCDRTLICKHFDANGNSAPMMTNENGTIRMDIQDGDVFGVEWPNCCTTGWAIAAEGWFLQTLETDDLLTGGVVNTNTRVTLCTPNGLGVIPINVVTPPTGAVYVQNYMLPPYTTWANPVFQATNGYNGGMWKAHISCWGCRGTTWAKCYLRIDTLAYRSCINPRWVLESADTAEMSDHTDAKDNDRFISPVAIMAHIVPAAKAGLYFKENAPSLTSVAVTNWTYHWTYGITNN